MLLRWWRAVNWKGGLPAGPCYTCILRNKSPWIPQDLLPDCSSSECVSILGGGEWGWMRDLSGTSHAFNHRDEDGRRQCSSFLNCFFSYTVGLWARPALPACHRMGSLVKRDRLTLDLLRAPTWEWFSANWVLYLWLLLIYWQQVLRVPFRSKSFCYKVERETKLIHSLPRWSLHILCRPAWVYSSPESSRLCQWLTFFFNWKGWETD